MNHEHDPLTSVTTIFARIVREGHEARYEEWLGGKTKQDAFIAAQKRLKAKWKSPYYWGAFKLVGFRQE